MAQQGAACKPQQGLQGRPTNTMCHNATERSWPDLSKSCKCVIQFGLMPSMLPWTIRSRTRSARAPAPQQRTLDLREWLSRHASISDDRLPALLAKLDEHWITDVPSLVRSISALERHLPAAAYMAIHEAALLQPQPVDGPKASERQWALASVADTATTEPQPPAPSEPVAAGGANIYASPVKFAGGEGCGFAEQMISSTDRPRRLKGGSPTSVAFRTPVTRTPGARMAGAPPPGASPASRAGAARFLADCEERSVRAPREASDASARADGYETSADLVAMRAAAFRREVKAQRRLISQSSRRALSPDGPLARLWEEWILAAAVILVVLAMPVEIAFVPPFVGAMSPRSAERYDVLWFANRAIEVIFSADVFFRLCLAYRERPDEGGRWVFGRGKILHRYLRTYMLVDLIAAIPIELCLWGVRRVFLGAYLDPTPYEALLRLNRLFKLLRPGHLYTWITKPALHLAPPPPPPGSKRRPSLLTRLARLAKLPAPPLVMRACLQLLFGALLLSHWFACAWAFTGMREAATILELDTLHTDPIALQNPPPLLQHPSPPTPPLPPAPHSPPIGIAPVDVDSLRAACWLARNGLLSRSTSLADAALSPPLQIYAAAWLASLASLFGVDASVAAPYGWVEHYVSSALLLLGGVARLLAIAFACAVLSAAWPHDAKYRQTFSELNKCIRDRRLPAPIVRRLRAFFRHTHRLEAASRYAALFASLSDRLRADTATAMSTRLLSCVPYLAPAPHDAVATSSSAATLTASAPSPASAAAISVAVEPPAARSPRLSLISPVAPPESAFLASVVLSLEPRLHCPREFLPVDRLLIFERGVAARRGRILSPGRCTGEDVVLARADLRDTEPAIALGFCQLLAIDRYQLLELARPHPYARAAIRRWAVQMALRRAFIAAAHERASQHGLVRHHGLFDEWRPPLGYSPLPPTAREDEEEDEPQVDYGDGNGDDARRARAMCAALEARLQRKLAAVADAIAASADAARVTDAQARACAVVAAASTPAPPAEITPADRLATAWPCTLQEGGGGRRRRSARSVDGSELIGGRHSHRCHSHRSSGSAKGHHRPSSTRSARHHFSARETSAELLARIERLEMNAAVARGGSLPATAASITQWPAAPVRADGTQSPPLSAERRYAAAAARAGGSPDLMC